MARSLSPQVAPGTGTGGALAAAAVACHLARAVARCVTAAHARQQGGAAGAMSSQCQPQHHLWRSAGPQRAHHGSTLLLISTSAAGVSTLLSRHKTTSAAAFVGNAATARAGQLRLARGEHLQWDCTASSSAGVR